MSMGAVFGGLHLKLSLLLSLETIKKKRKKKERGRGKGEGIIYTALKQLMYSNLESEPVWLDTSSW